MCALPYIVLTTSIKIVFMAPVCWLKPQNMNPVS